MTLFHVVSRYHSSSVYGEHNVIFHICSPLFAFRPAPCKNTANHVFSHISVAINSARCVQHLSHTGACHSLHLKHSCPDLKSPNGLLPTVWAMRNKWDVLPSPIVPLPLAPFFQFWVHLPGIICRCLQLYFFHRQTIKAIRMLYQLLDGNQDCCMWPSHLNSDYASIRTGMKAQACRQLMLLFGLCRPGAFRVGATNLFHRLTCDNIGSCCWHPAPDTIIQTQQCYIIFICVGRGDGGQLNMAVLLLPILWLGESHAASESREEVLQNKQEVSEQSTNPSHNSIHSHSIH